MTGRQSEKSDATGARSAAYAHDGRAPGWRSSTTGQGGNWHPRLAVLVDAGYIFLQQGYAGGGTLFRGVGGGLLEALAEQSFWHFSSGRPLASLERELDVIFCSEHAGDALTAALPWEAGANDAGLLMFSSNVYRDRSRQRAAAMLALADPGMVFKYPLLAEPLRWDDIDMILTSEDTLQRCRAAASGELVAGLGEHACYRLQQLACSGLFDRLRGTPAHDRTTWADAVADSLQQVQSAPAQPVAVADWPKRSEPCAS
jgi:hypothetical protein